MHRILEILPVRKTYDLLDLPVFLIPPKVLSPWSKVMFSDLPPSLDPLELELEGWILKECLFFFFGLFAFSRAAPTA